ncbi:MAG: TolC family protein [Prevotellaceae bacterium]|jgi:outer membrane protein TolC|nr:TolC family protein [Prevotellaceae bacterium]
MKRIHILLFFTLALMQAQAQILTLDEALNISLQNNYNISVARNEVELARLNNSLGNAGMLPTVDLNGTGQYAFNNIHQKDADGTKTSQPDQGATSLGANVELNWTLFDGGRMFIAKNRLEELERLSGIRYEAQVLQTVYDVIEAYYAVVKEQQQLRSINEVIDYNRERVKIAETGFTAGSLVKTELLTAKIDLNVSLEDAVTQQFAIEAACRKLNVLMGRNAALSVDVVDSIPPSVAPDKAELLSKLYSSNADVLAAAQQIKVMQLALRENKRAYLPSLGVYGGYYFNYNHYSKGITLENRVHGPQVGATLTVPLYRAGETKRKVAQSKLELQTAQLDLDNIKLQAAADLENAYTAFEDQQKLLNIEIENNLLARENFEISLHRLRLGQTTSLEVHQAQEDFEQSAARLINFKYNLKIAETKLKQLVAEWKLSD